MLIVLGGLPGTGKTTIGKALAAKRSAAYVRIDEIEHALRRQLPGFDLGAAGYIVGQAIALSNLTLGLMVVADSVNPVAASRQGWRDVAANAKAQLLEIELICSDPREHRRRLETRIADIEGFSLPSFASVQAHDYAPWTKPRLILDTSILSAADCLAAIERRIALIGSLE